MSTFVERPYLPALPLAITAVPAMLVTAVLILLMHSLIANDMAPPEVEPRRVIEFVGAPPDIPLPPPDYPLKPPEVAKPPEWLETEFAYSPEDTGDGWQDVVSLPEEKTDPVVGTGNTMVVAYLKVQPVYPSRALSRGIEGHVDLAFDITAAGATTNVRVLAAEPRGVFERAAIAALNKWKYKVPLVDDVPQGQVDMMTRLTFEIED